MNRLIPANEERNEKSNFTFRPSDDGNKRLIPRPLGRTRGRDLIPFIFRTCVLLVLMGGVLVSQANTVDTIRQQIEARNNEIGKLEQEIKQYESRIQEVGKEKQTLQTTIQNLSATDRKLSGELRVTETKISRTNLTLEETAREINRLEGKVTVHKGALREMIQSVQQANDVSMIETMLTYKNFSEAWEQVDSLIQIQSTLKESVHELTDTRAVLESQYAENAQQKASLEGLRGQLSDQKKVVEYNTQEKNQILRVTQNKEAEYQRLLKEKETARSQMESDLQELETKLQYALDPSKIPGRGSGVLRYPIANPQITQGYGLTSFALAGAYGYTNGQPNPHRGVDFRASIGTPIFSSADGVVRQAFDMDSIPGCRSYGQWILVDHDNGLSTLYTHLSVMSLRAGAPVKAGTIIGYSGNSGYSTGPHLHFSVFPRDGVQVQKFSTSVGCKNALVPIAAHNAYLNPLDYLK